MPRSDAPVLDEESAAPRFSWRALIFVFAFVATIASAWAIQRVEVADVRAHLDYVDVNGTQLLRQHIDAQQDDVIQLNVRSARIEEKLNAVIERLDRIEKRLDK